MNSVNLIGRVATSPKMKYSKHQDAICFFRLAVRRNFLSGGEDNQTTDFFNVVCYRRVAENAFQYLKKGYRIAVHGRIENRKYKRAGENGPWAWTFQVVGEVLEYLDRKEKDDFIEQQEVEWEQETTNPPEEVPF